MVSCLGRKEKNTRKSSSFYQNAYPPPIKIQKSIVIPGFIREGRQLSRTLSLNLNSENSIYSISSSVTSTEGGFGEFESRNNILNNYHSFNGQEQEVTQPGYPALKGVTESFGISENSNLNNEQKAFEQKTTNSFITNPIEIKSNKFKKKESNYLSPVNTGNNFNSENVIEIENNENPRKFVIFENSTSKKDALKDSPTGISPRIETSSSKSKVSIVDKKSIRGRKRILSAPNEPIVHVEDVLNLELKEKQIPTSNTKPKIRSPSLKLLAKTVINLMNKRGSKGRQEKKEANTLNQLIDKNWSIRSSSLSSKSTNSTKGSDSSINPSTDRKSSREIGNLIKKLSSTKKQVSFEMDFEKPNRKKSSSVSRRISKLFSRKASSNSTELESNKQPEPLKSNINLETEIFLIDKTKLDNLQLSTMSRSISSETLCSNFSTEQRVANTYDMQILTYEQTPIPIPNLPKGRRLKSIDNIENCYLLDSPNISRILSACYNR
ncbi:hypothetical protein HWI79_2014 [Cryptosporidium felis]|nr:hypothetical protein HWI79_2014 [Cryptosporidium felis]